MMKRILKLFAVLWLIVGCSAFQSTTQKLAGKYVCVGDGHKLTIILESPNGKDNTSGNASGELDDDKTYYGTYKVYEGKEMVLVKLDNHTIAGATMKFHYDLDSKTLTFVSRSGKIGSAVFNKK